MITIYPKFGFIIYFVAFFFIVFLTGCASTRTKVEAFEAVQGKDGFVYAQVNSVEPGEVAKTACESNIGGDELKESRELICHRLAELKFINLSTLRSKIVFTSAEVIPKNLETQRGAIVKLDLSKPKHLRFVEVVSNVPTDTCKWIGSDNELAYDSVTKAGSVVGAFVGGVLLLPAAVHFSSDRQGGVECNGWSYKTAYKDFLSKY